MSFNTRNLVRCIATLEKSLIQLNEEEPGTIDYEILRNACVKGFELTLETSGKLLRKALKAYIAAPRTVDEWVYKEVLRNACKHGLLDSDAVLRWFQYRDNRNTTAHDYGEAFAEETLRLLPSFLKDAYALEKTLSHKFSGIIDDT